MSEASERTSSIRKWSNWHAKSYQIPQSWKPAPYKTEKRHETLTSADKTSNMYRLSKEEHEQRLANVVTSTYKKANNSIKKKINMAGKQILKNNEILNRVEINGENNCLFTLKDHKNSFANNPQVRLINPAKNELGRISKVILDKTNLAIREHFSFN